MEVTRNANLPPETLQLTIPPLEAEAEALEVLA
jgi:hypothetical protein